MGRLGNCPNHFLGTKSIEKLIVIILRFPFYCLSTHISNASDTHFILLKFIYSEKATKFCEILLLLLTTVHTVKSKVNISQNFVAFSEYMNFKKQITQEFFSQNLKNDNCKNVLRIQFGIFNKKKQYLNRRIDLDESMFSWQKYST